MKIEFQVLKAQRVIWRCAIEIDAFDDATEAGKFALAEFHREHPEQSMFETELRMVH